MPLQPLIVPAQSNSFITAFTLCVLLPTVNNDAVFDTTRVRLFGEISGRLTAGIINELERANVNQFPTLIALIQSHFRPKLVAHANLRREDYQPLFESQESFRLRVESLGCADSPSDAFEQRVLSDYLGVTIEIVHGLYPDLGAPNPTPKLYFSIRDGSHYYFVESDTLPEMLCRELFPLMPTQAPQVVDLVRFQQAKSKNLLQHMFQVTSDEDSYLDNLSKNAGITKPTDSELSPADVKFVLRFNLENELRNLRTVVEQVQLTTGYDIALVPREGCTQKRIIYAAIGQTGFDYTLCEETGGTTTDFLEYGVLETNKLRFQHPVTIGQLKKFLPKIQEKLEERGHIIVAKAQIGGEWSWTRSMGYSATTGGITGAAALGTVTAIGEIAGTGVGLGLIPFAGIPIAIAFFGAVMGAAWWGKSCAVEYEKTLDTVNQLLSQELYDDAAELLDKQLQQWSFGTRELFLTKQHEALMHFFVALCARKMGRFQKAYEHFILTYNAARSIDKKSAAFIAKLQLLELLKNTPPEQGFTVKVSESMFRTKDVAINRQQEAEKIISELTGEFTEGFTEYYWYIIGRLQDWSIRFKRAQSLTAAEMVIDRRNVIAEANFFLVARDFYILKAYANGYGAFLEVLSTFYQGAILDYFCHVNVDYLDTNVRNMLVLELLNGNAPERNIERVLALKKFERTSTLLRDYKIKYPEMTRNRAISATIQLVESFILKFYATWVDNRNLRIEAFQNIANTLGKERAISDRLYAEIKFPIDFLARIQRDFGICFEDEEQWLDGLLKNPSQIAHLVSERTGDTMLHLLTSFQTSDTKLADKARAGALKLQEHRYRRNHNHETPLMALNANDPLRLVPVLCPSVLISMGDELQRIDDFLSTISRNPACDGHFLLLEGPPGTGKTTSVLTHLRERGHTIYEWEAGVPLSEKTRRITEFFAQRVARDVLTVFFIDEIDVVIPRSDGGTPPTGYYNPEQDVGEFLRRITALNGQKAVLIGATNYPERMAAPALSRAASNRISFSLPTELQRKQLLMHLFRLKHIEQRHIDLVAKVAVGYAPRELRALVDKMPDIFITFEILSSRFNDYVEVLRRTFSKEYAGAELFMPSLQFEGDLDNVFPDNVALADQLLRLKSNTITGNGRHTLLYGPPGGGKTTAARIYAQKSGQVLISIKANSELRELHIAKIFDRAKQFGRVLIFIDEIDRIAFPRAPLTGFLQTEMDGVTQNNVTLIGATNYRDGMESAVLSRFGMKIHLPALTPEQLARPIQRTLVERTTIYQGQIYFEQELSQAMMPGAAALGEISQDLSLRDVGIAIDLLFGDIGLEKPTNYPGITYLRMMDVRFSFLLRRIQENLMPAPPNMKTQMQYIRDERTSFFRATPPENSVLSSTFRYGI